MSDVRRRREYFFEYLAERALFVKELCFDRGPEGLILLTSYIEAVGRYRYPELGRNRDRFVQVLQEDSGFDQWRFISLVGLAAGFNKSGTPDEKHLISVLSKLFDTAPESFFKLSHNPDVGFANLADRVSFDARAAKTLQASASRIRRFEYSNIAWRQFRNPAVHELSTMAESIPPMADRPTPYYAVETVHADAPELRQLLPRFCLPRDFLYRSFLNCVEGLRNKWEEAGTDPASIVPWDIFGWSDLLS